MHRTIRFRMALLISALMLIVLIGFGVFIYASLSTQLFSSLDANLILNAEQILPILENENGHLVFGRGDVIAIPSIEQDDLFRLVAPTGQILDSRGQNNDLPIPSASIIGNGGFFTITYYGKQSQKGQGQSQQGEQDHQDSMRLYSTPVMTNGQIVAYLQIGHSTDLIQDTLKRLLTLLLIAGPALIATTALSGYWLAGRALAPIERIRRQAAAIGAENLGKRLNLDLPDDEVGRLARTFDQMLARLDESFQRQRRFTADASHELRTPLAVIRGEVDVVLERNRSPQEYRETLQSVGTEAERMSRLVANLLLLTRGDNAELTLDYHPLDVADMLRVLVEQMQPRAEAADVIVRLDLPEPLLIQADSDRLLQLFVNLLDNAFVYAPHGELSVRGWHMQEVIEISVTDTGPGIHPEHLSHLFERFYRLEKARSRTSGGSGLGLAIAQEIARAHGGDITVDSTPGKGTTFRVRLPILTQT
ncbi:MAG: heavy metal sensor histidine kinase [Chloroflexi bacterium]|nr:heavy metal sensor histidine kinase [Chloroflexota bacterium]